MASDTPLQTRNPFHVALSFTAPKSFHRTVVSPFTSSLLVGVFIPIPTFPFQAITK